MAFDAAGFDQCPWSMANGGDRLARIDEVPDQRDRLVVDTQGIRVRHAPGDTSASNWPAETFASSWSTFSLSAFS